MHKIIENKTSFGLTNIQKSYYIGKDSNFEVGGIPTYVYYEFENDFEHDRFEKVLNQLIAFQPMLRAKIESISEQKIQSVSEYGFYPVKHYNFSNLKEEIQAAKLAAVREEIISLLKNEKELFTFRTATLSNQKTCIFCGCNLLIADAFSLVFVMLKELRAGYHQLDQIVTCKQSFSDYVSLKEMEKQSEAYQMDKQFWKSRISEIPPAPEIAIKKEGLHKIPVGKRLKFVMDGEIWKSIRTLSRENRVTPTVTVLTAYAMTLGFWSNQERFSINMPVMDRPNSEKNQIDFSNVIGDFTSLRIVEIENHISRDMNFWEYAQSVKAAIRLTTKHKAYDGTELIKDLVRMQNTPNKAMMPYVFTSMILGNAAYDAITEFGKIRYSFSQTPQVYLDCQAMEDNGTLTVTWDYNTELFEEDEITFMFHKFSSLLESICKSGRINHSFFALSASDQILLANYNCTERRFPYDSVMPILQKRLKECKDHIAVQDDKIMLTYEELDLFSDEAANCLREKGIKAGDVVAICSARTVWTVVSILATLKCGAAFVNINEDYPENRKTYIIEKANAKLFVDSNLIGEKSKSECRRFEVTYHTKGEDLAYAIFTSGSTGTPKGVAITHKSLCNTILDINERFSITEADRILCVTSFCFDLSIYDIFGSLTAGATLYIAQDSRDIDRLIQIMEREKITFLNCVPAITNLLVARCKIKNEDYQNDTMRLFLMSGDWIPVTLPEKIKSCFPKSRSISLGGATEGSIWSICHPIVAEDAMRTSIPYGKPLSNQTMYILNDALIPCSIGTIGEIYIGGCGVAAGYLNDLEKTNAAFLETEEFGRLYKTGDFGRMLHSGEMEFLGRRDSQVKIHGHRIELSEIETVFVQYKEIKNAVADVKQVNREMGHLCIYYTAPTQYSKEELSKFLNQYLTKYMIPEFYIRLDEIPLTANGKVNRKALPMPNLVNADELLSGDETYSDTQQMLISIWSEFLGLEADKINIHTGFFNLGGDSVNMIQIIGEIEKKFGVNIPFQKFLQHSTIQEISSILDAEKVEEKEISDPEFIIQPDSKYEPFPLSELQESYFIGRNAEGYKGLATNGYVELECKQYDDERFRYVLKKLIERHDMLRAVIHADGTQQILKSAELPDIEVSEQFGLSGKALESYCRSVRQEMTMVRLDLERPPLIKILVTLLNHKSAIIHIYVDGLIIDGWSYQIFHLELEELYQNPKKDLPSLTASYRDYILYKAYQKKTKKYQKAKQYWLSKIPNLPEAGTLPLLSDFQHLSTIEGGQVKCGLKIEDWKILEEKSKIFGISPFVVIFTSFALTIARWNRKQRFLLNIPEFDRPQFHEDVNSIIGVCSSFLLFTVENDPNISFFEMVRRTHEQLWELKEHNSFSGMEVLREIYKDIHNYETALVPIVFGMMANVELPKDSVMHVNYQENHTTQIWIDITTTLYPDRIEFNWNFIHGLLDQAMLERMVQIQEEILHKAIYEEIFWELPCRISLPEYDYQIIQKLNDTKQKFSFTSFSLLLEKSFCQYQEKRWISDETRSFTYGEFRNYVMGMAKKLQDAGCKKGDFVCLQTKKSIEQVAAIFAVVWIGAVYVPLEYHYDPRLVRNCMKKIDARFFITDQPFSEEGICVIKNGLFLSETPIAPVETEESALIEVIHTSGSTGLPKAVRITQKGLLNSILFTNKKINICTSDVFICLENYAHDMSMYDLFGSLFSGASVVIPVEEKAKDPDQWMLLMKRYSVTVWNSVPAFLQMMLEHNQGVIPDCMKQVRVILSGGDYLNLKTAAILKEQIPHLQLINVGGPTETTLWNIGHTVTEEDLKKGQIPYGKPIANTKYYILNDHEELCPIGVPGMMYCAGIGVSDGYIGQPDENFKKFSFFEPTGERIYNTGDLGMYDQDGNIIFLGREDLQVEINGKRIELNGINQSMIAHPDIQNCVSATSKDGNSIIAYYVSEREIGTEEMNSFLSDKIPYFEIPKFYVHVKEIPLTNNGKVDYKALESYALDSIVEEKKMDNVPRDAIEQKLLDTYSEMLGVPADLHTDFFAMGGNSLMAVKMVAKIRSEFEIPMTLTEMFSVLTISELYDLIQRKLSEKKGRGLKC